GVTAGQHRGLRIAVSTAVVAAAVLLGVGLGHTVWTTTTTVSRGFPRFGFPGGSNGFTIPSVPNGFGDGSGVQGSGGPSNAAAIEKMVDPALVDINATFNYQQASGEGTGIVLTSTGEVLTNNHVIEGATSISVTDVGNGRTYGATVVGYDAAHDVAVLQLAGAADLAAATIGDSSRATVGEEVLAIGNAGGGGGTPTSAGGSIAELDQSVTASDSLDGTSENLAGMIAVTADVQPGDSGGPLVNGSGKVLGIDTAGPSGFAFDFSTQTSGAAGYAIPIDEATTIATAIESGTPTSSIHVGPTAFLGVLITAGSGASTSGAKIASVVSGGAASKAGVVTGDVITSINGMTIGSASSVSQALIPLHPGDTASISWTTSSGHQVTASATLQSGPAA
ncbi:MAG TPA: trypsin-like peptidase domain-containing protein, partial [Acidimicrobiales bacterium]|nr:trypsin-like peptidase domain-containing protein [Acidimicrobiales bacterium]